MVQYGPEVTAIKSSFQEARMKRSVHPSFKNTWKLRMFSLTSQNLLIAVRETGQCLYSEQT